MVDVNTWFTHAVVEIKMAVGMTHLPPDERQYRLTHWFADPGDTFTFIDMDWHTVRIAPVGDPANPFNIPLVFARKI